MYIYEEETNQQPDLEATPLTDNHITELFGSLLDFDDVAEDLTLEEEN